jgi:hypothetical protein
MIAAWKKFWFAPDDPFNLGAVRFFVCCGGAVFYFFMRDVHPDGFFTNWRPISFYQLMSGPISWQAVEWIRYTWLVFTFLAGLGLAFRFTITVGVLAGVFYNGYSYNFGWVYHSGHLYIMALIILSFSRAGDGFRIFPRKQEVPAPSSAYRWPVRLIQGYVVYVFFLCGAQKVWHAGNLDWAFSNSFFNMLMSTAYQTPLNVWIQSQHPWVARFFAAGALFVVELGAPLAFLNRRMAVIYFFLWSFFHVMVTNTFGIHRMFFSQIFAYTAFIDWRSVFGRILLVRNGLKA